MYQITLIVDEEIPEDIAADALLEVHKVIDIGDESGFGIVGRIISIRIRQATMHD